MLKNLAIACFELSVSITVEKCVSLINEAKIELMDSSDFYQCNKNLHKDAKRSFREIPVNLFQKSIFGYV